MDTLAGPLRETGLVATGLAVVTACAVAVARSGRVVCPIRAPTTGTRAAANTEALGSCWS
jgi:hypothetical protein